MKLYNKYFQLKICNKIQYFLKLRALDEIRMFFFMFMKALILQTIFNIKRKEISFWIQNTERMFLRKVSYAAFRLEKMRGSVKIKKRILVTATTAKWNFCSDDKWSAAVYERLQGHFQTSLKRSVWLFHFAE